MCGENLVSKTVVILLSSILLLSGIALTGVGVYSRVKHANDPFFDAFVEDGFKKETAITYIGELRVGNYSDADLKAAYNGFQHGFSEKFIQETLVKKALKYKKDNEDNVALSFWLEGFREFALCEKDCTRNRTSADIIADYVNKRTQEFDAVGNSAATVVNAGVKVSNGVKDAVAKASDSVRRLLPTRRVASSVKVNEAAERRRETVTVQILTGGDVADAPVGSSDANPGSGGSPSGNTKAAPETQKLSADKSMTEQQEDAFNAGYDTAQVISDFALNWVVAIVLGMILLVLGGLSCKALTKRWIAFLLCLCLWFIGIFCFLQYGQSQGWEFCEKWLSKLNFGGVVMSAEENLRKNKTSDLALQSILGFYKPWYLILISGLFMILGSMYMKLACSSNMSTDGKDFI